MTRDYIAREQRAFRRRGQELAPLSRPAIALPIRIFQPASSRLCFYRHFRASLVAGKMQSSPFRLIGGVMAFLPTSVFLKPVYATFDSTAASAG